MATEIVDNDDVAGSQGRQQDLLDIGEKAQSTDRSIDDAQRLDAVAGDAYAIAVVGENLGDGLPRRLVVIHHHHPLRHA